MGNILVNAENSLWSETLGKISHDVYHLPEYVSLEAKRSNAEAEAFVFIEGDKIFFLPYLLRECGEIFQDELGGEKAFDVISPYGYPGILLSESASNCPEFVDTALSKLKYLFRQKNIVSAFLRLHPILSDRFLEVFPDNFFTDNGQTVSMDLTLSEEKIWAKTRKGHQSTINKCKRLGFEGSMVSFRDYMEEFMEIYTETMNRVQAKDSYYFDEDYFRGLLKLGDRLHLGIVKMGDEIACCSLFFESCGIVQAHLGGTTDKYISQSPFNYLLHYVRLWAKQRGNSFLHIGGGIGGSTDDSLYKFKSGFSKQRHSFFTCRMIVDETKYNQMAEIKANYLEKSVEELLQTNFFPVYRA